MWRIAPQVTAAVLILRAWLSPILNHPRRCEDRDMTETQMARWTTQDIPDQSGRTVLITGGNLDLADLTSVERFSTAFLASGRGLDLLVNNAGVMAIPQRETTAQGYERQFGDRK